MDNVYTLTRFDKVSMLLGKVVILTVGVWLAVGVIQNINRNITVTINCD